MVSGLFVVHDYGYTALHYACESGMDDVVVCLLKHARYLLYPPVLVTPTASSRVLARRALFRAPALLLLLYSLLEAVRATQAKNANRVFCSRSERRSLLLISTEKKKTE